MRKHWRVIVLALLVVLPAFAIVRVEHVKDEGVELWDVHLSDLVVTYTYDTSEGPVFWLTREGRTLLRWPDYGTSANPKTKVAGLAGELIWPY